MEAAEGILFCSWTVAQRHQRTDIEKMMNQLITAVVLDYGQKRAVGNIKGKWTSGRKAGGLLGQRMGLNQCSWYSCWRRMNEAGTRN